MSIVAILTLVFAVCMPLSTFFHVVRMYKEKRSDGQSIWTPLVLTIGSTLWLFYGIEIGDILLIIANILWIMCNSIYVLTILYYRKDGGVVERKTR